MKTMLRFVGPALGLLFLLGGLAPLHAEITVRLSVKFIRNSDGTWPAGGISTATGFADAVTRGNGILAATGRTYQLEVVEYRDIQPAAPAGEAADYWFTLDARANRATIEAAALGDMAPWIWNGTAINLYVNNSSSGQCSYVGGGSSISLGGTASAATVLHEIGHFFNLKHTHVLDYKDNANTPPYTEAQLGDGDGLSETAKDNPNIANTDELCGALFGVTFALATPPQRAVVNSAFENVMSYHNENELLSVQMDIWGLNANGARLVFCRGRTWFVANEGSDDSSGNDAGAPFATLLKGLATVGSRDDAVLLRAGNYNAPANGLLNTPCTLSATRGDVSIRRP